MGGLLAGHRPVPVAWALGIALLGACGLPSHGADPTASPGAAAAPSAARWEWLRAPTPEEAALLVARQASRPTQRDHHAALVYLNLDGAPLAPGAYQESDAQRDVSCLIASSVDFPPFTGAPFETTQAEARLVLLDGLRALYAGYRVAFTDQRPADASYSMVMVGGSPEDVGQPSGTLGMAPLDCVTAADGPLLNLNSLDVVFAFSDEAARLGLDLDGLVYVIGHELGHALGLGHIDRPGDVMFPNIWDDSARSWGAGPTIAGDDGCALDAFQDDRTFLLQAVGPGYPQQPPPTVSISAPVDGTVVEDGWVEVTVAASSPTFVKRVEIWVNGASRVSLDAPPYVARLAVPAPGIYSIRADVWDPYNMAESPAVNVFVRLPPPVACTEDTDCGSVWRCADGLCLGPPPTPAWGDLGSPCTSESDCVSGRCRVAAANYCSRACREDVGAYCPFGYRCAADGYCESLTEIAPGGLGTACSRDRQCQGRVCVNEGDQSYCSERCWPDGTPCPMGAECLAQPGSSSYTCGRPRSGGCTVGRGLESPPSAAAAFALLAALGGVLRRARRRR